RRTALSRGRCVPAPEPVAAVLLLSSSVRVGNPYDNAKAERFMRTLKDEEIDGRAYRDLDHARSSIGEFIEAVHNSQRLHSALDYLSPDGYEAGLTRLRQENPVAIQNPETVTG